MKTYSAKPSDVTRQWYVIDASEAPMGRIATQAAQLLTGKGKPQFTHHIDVGDFVIIINAGQTVATGAKGDKKVYYRHSNYPGGLKDPTFPITTAIRGMLPVNKLRDERLKRLKVYVGAEHNHAAQKPTVISASERKEAK
jgi:large subunit ribosomal protein L13